MKRSIYSCIRLFLCLTVCLTLVIPSPVAARKKTPKKASKKPRLHPKEVAKNELIDKRFLQPYKAGIKALHDGKLDAALKFAQQAIRLRPQSGRAMLIMGTAYKRKKMYSSAIQYFQQAAKVSRGKAMLYEKGQALYNVAFCFELQNQRSNAITAWQLYLSHAATYHMNNSQTEFARKRTQILRSVKGPPNP